MKLIFIIFAFCLIINSNLPAQLLPGGQTERYEDQKDNMNGLGSIYSVVELKPMWLGDGFSGEFGAKAGFLFDGLAIGTSLNFRVTKTVEDPKYVGTRPQLYFNFNHAGIFIEKNFRLTNKLLISGGVMANIAITSYELNNQAGLTPINTIDWYFLLEPNVNLSYKIYKKNYANINLFYRYSTGIGETTYPTNYFGGYGFGIGLKSYF